MIKINILGVNLSPLESYEQAYLLIKDVTSLNIANYITVNNVHTLIEGVKNKQYRNILNNSYLAFTDSQPLTTIIKNKSTTNITRIFGPTLFEKVMEYGQNDKLTHFYFGSTIETLNKIKYNVEIKYSNAKIVGMIAPPFRPINEVENDYYLSIINDAKSDIVWVGPGAPKQEKWMYSNVDKLKSGIMIGIGAGFDYVAGNTKHAPEWMKNMSLEWLYRLIQEPRRLWKRYLVSNTLFIYFLLIESLGLKKYK